MADVDQDLLQVRRAAFASDLREIRARRRLSQEEVANRAGITRVFYGSLERAESNVSLDRLWAIADALDVPVTELLAG